MEKETKSEIERKGLSRSGRDWMLQTLINLVNTQSFSFDVTITIGSLLVSGTLISTVKYQEKFWQQFGAGLLKDEEKAKDFVSSIVSNFEAKVSENPDPSLVGFIHLDNAFFFGVDNHKFPTNDKGLLWRGNLEHVSSFVLGRISAA